jgi:hypothetical protein
MKTGRIALGFVFNFLLFVNASHAAAPLDEWAERTVPGSGYTLNSVAFGNGVFVAVGDSGVMLLSGNGVNWTNTSPVGYGALARIRFLNGQFTVVGDTNVMYRSSDGVTWTTSPLPNAKNFWDVAYGNSRYIVVGDSVYVSTDAVNWTPADPAISNPIGGLITFRLNTLVFGNGEFVGMAHQNSGQGYGEFHTTDGAAWTFTSGPYMEAGPAHLRSDFLYAGGRYLIANAGNGSVYTSTNGVTWGRHTATYLFGGPDRLSVSGGAGNFVAVGRESFGSPYGFAFFSSTDATNWVRRFPVVGTPTSTFGFSPNGVAFGHGTFVVVGSRSSAGTIIFQSGNLSGAPTIISEPQDRAAVVGNPASFTVSLTGDEPLVYQWFKGSNTITNATNSTLVISNVVAVDSGGYQVVISNSFGSVTSRVAQLSVSFLNIKQYAGITILGLVGKTYRIDAAPAAGGGWTTLTNVVLPKSPYIWIDYDSPDVDARIYRAAELP